MSFSQWISSIFQPQRPTSCHLHLLNENQPLQTMPPLNPVEFNEYATVGESTLDLLFQESISSLGGKENILLIGQAGVNPENNDENRRVLEELCFTLFGQPRNYPSWMKDAGAGEETSKALSCVTSKSPAKCRMLDYPVILPVFRDTLLRESTYTTLVREVLKDVQIRTRKSGSVVVAIVYSQEPYEEESIMKAKEHLGKLMTQIFKKQPWGICCFCSFQPESIKEVKRTIDRTLGRKLRGQELYSEYQNYDVDRSFQDLVCQLGGKERFLLLGNVCPSTRPSKKAGAFKELIKALFDDQDVNPSSDEGGLNLRRNIMTSEECSQLSSSRSFPHPLILVVFSSTFLKEDYNRAQVKEILVDIRTRIEMPSTQVIGVVCSQNRLDEAEKMELQVLLQKLLCQIFRCPTAAVCSFERTQSETADQVKRCVCGVLKPAP
ncbi:uncharacterized protein [Hyperolius riggenbachi]|uniref:uncharacterized protein n=1 Tax=Hyperolius riggenbachi TaxID=752182 RepID=UPI0035A32216